MTKKSIPRIDPTSIREMNGLAFQALERLQSYCSQPIAELSSHNPIEIVNDGFVAISEMAKQYIEFKPEDRASVQAAFARAYTNALKVVEPLEILARSGDFAANNIRAFGQAHNERGVYSLIAKLPAEFERESPEYSLSVIDTYHGLLRYFHQMLIQLPFDAKILKNLAERSRAGTIEYTLNRGTFNILDLGDQISPEVKEGHRSMDRKHVRNKAMQAIFDFYEQNILTEENENYFVYLKENGMDFYLSLYQHSSEVNVLLNGDRSYIGFNYNEFLNAAWRDRIDYLIGGLSRLGFKMKNVEKDRNTQQDHDTENIVAEKKDTDEISVCGTLTELVRLLASSTHMNCAFEYCRGFFNPEDMLKVFFTGETDLHDVIRRARKNIEILPPRPAHYYEDLATDSDGTYEEKLAHAEKAIAADIKNYWEKVEAGKISIGESAKNIKNLPSLDELVPARLRKFNIKK